MLVVLGTSVFTTETQKHRGGRRTNVMKSGRLLSHQEHDQCDDAGAQNEHHYDQQQRERAGPYP